MHNYRTLVSFNTEFLIDFGIQSRKNIFTCIWSNGKRRNYTYLRDNSFQKYKKYKQFVFEYSHVLFTFFYVPPVEKITLKNAVNCSVVITLSYGFLYTKN